MSDEWKEGGKKVESSTVTFGAVNDFIKGTYTGKKSVMANGKQTTLYELKGILGNYHTVDSKKNPIEPAVNVEAGAYYSVWGGKDAIDGLFNKSKLGDIVAIQLEKEVESKTKGNAPFKVFDTLQFGTDPNYMGEDSSSQHIADAVEDVGF